MSVINVLMSSVHAWSSLVRYCVKRSGFLELSVVCEKLMIDRMVRNYIRERASVEDEENRALGDTVREL